MKHLLRHLAKTGGIFSVALWLSIATPAAAWAQTATPEPTPTPTTAASETITGAPADTGAPSCTGASCTQGLDQGYDQGVDQGYNQGTAGDGGTSQGADQGLTNGIEGTNTTTGADSTNTIDVTADSTNTTSIDNTSNTALDASATATTGGNTSNSNSGTGAISTGNAGIGVTQVINDNSTTIGGTSGLQVSGYNGDYTGDYALGFGAGTATLTGDNGGSVRATNDTTGYDSLNTIGVTTTVEDLIELQNDGRIDNILELAAISGQNQAAMNTGDGSITTGDADVAATLVNLLNTTVINGSLWITVADIFGDLNGNIVIPDLAAWLASYAPTTLAVDAGNDTTGANSTNTVDVDVADHAATTIDNDADIDTTVTANAITGQNNTDMNTGGGLITTGDGQVTAGNVSLANTTIEGGNWGLFIINALNGWLGFLVGDQGQVQALSQEETLRRIDANNSTTGADSDNTINVDHTQDSTTAINNDAVINNNITADAITGQNDANLNTGTGQITTGNANIAANTVNIANTTVKDGSLFIAVVNVFGDWFGDLLYGGNSLTAATSTPSATVAINASNGTTGSNSTNTVDVTYDRERDTTVTNEADITATLNANIDTGSNHASKNTGGALVDTGDGLLAMHSRAVANLTGIAGDVGLGVSVTGLNDTTGAESENRINATINDDRVVTVNNVANVSTVLGSTNTPALVNTGGNSADMNTLGAIILTGDASAEIAIQNMVNQVMLALVGHGVTIDADFTNQLTGTLSTNENELTAEQRVILTIINRGFIANLLNLLLNTGGNTANKNTGGSDISAGAALNPAGGGVAIVTGDGCVTASIDNQLNQVSGVKGAKSNEVAVDATAHNTTTGSLSTNNNTINATSTTTSSVTNSGQAINAAGITVTTGNNEQTMNTGGSNTVSKDNGACNKIAQAPEASPTPTPKIPASPTPGPSGGGEQPGGGGEGGGEADPAGGGEEARVAGVQKDQPTIAKKGLLERFPVAGSQQVALLLQGKQRLPWQLFVVLSMSVLAGAWLFDRKASSRHLGSIVQ